MEAAEISQLIGELEERVERLRALYDQYFMGIERLEPTILRKDVDRRLWALRREQIRNTGLRFKLETAIQRYNTYQQYWQRIVREIENGTYQRDLGRAAQRFGENAVTAFAKRRQKMFEKGQIKKAERQATRRGENSEPESAQDAIPSNESYDVAFDDSDFLADQAPLSLDFGSVAPPPASLKASPPSPAVPGPPRPPKPPVKLVAVSPGTMRELPKAAPPSPRPPAESRPDLGPGPAHKAAPTPTVASHPDEELSATRLRQIYGQYVDAKRKANESTAAITFEKVAANLRETATQLRAKTKSAIDFEVVMKNGRPVLKPVVKG